MCVLPGEREVKEALKTGKGGSSLGGGGVDWGRKMALVRGGRQTKEEKGEGGRKVKGA